MMMILMNVLCREVESWWMSVNRHHKNSTAWSWSSHIGTKYDVAECFVCNVVAVWASGDSTLLLP